MHNVKPLQSFQNLCINPSSLWKPFCSCWRPASLPWTQQSFKITRIKTLLFRLYEDTNRRWYWVVSWSNYRSHFELVLILSYLRLRYYVRTILRVIIIIWLYQTSVSVSLIIFTMILLTCWNFLKLTLYCNL